MGVTAFVVNMNVVRDESTWMVADAFAGVHYLSMFGEVSYASSLPECMQLLVSRWLSRHGFPGGGEVLCGSLERRIVELAYVSAQRVVLIEDGQGCADVLVMLDRLRGESWSLYEALCSRLSLVVYGDGDGLEGAPVPVMGLRSWREVHEVVAWLGLAGDDGDFAPVAVPEEAERVMCV